MDAIARLMANKMVERKIVSKEHYGRAVYKATLFVTSMFITVVMLIISVATWTPQAALMYMLSYFIIHSCSPTIHFKRYIYCFSLSVGAYLVMTLLLIFLSTSNLWALTVIALIYCFGVLLSGMLNECGRPFPAKAQFMKWGIWIMAILLLAFLPIDWAFPFTFGMLFINTFQLKARNHE